MDYGYGVGSAATTAVDSLLGFFTVVFIVALVVGVFSIICNWKIFKKAGKQGWEAIVPVYNMFVLLEITNLPIWYLVLLFVPFVNSVILVLIYIALAKKFGQSTLFGLGLIFFNPIFMAILAFSDSCIYQGSSVMSNGVVQQTIYNNEPVEQTVYDDSVQSQTIEQPAQANNCSKCGAPVNAGDKFCMYCGNQL